MIKSLVLAGGCFWCVEHDMREAVGVTSVAPGYSGGTNDLDPRSEFANSPTYESHAGHREVILVEYDSSKINYKKLLQFFIDHIDPTDIGGQFHDRGEAYKSAIYYEGDEEKKIAEGVIKELNDSKIYGMPSAVDILPRKEFYIAEEYHQNYAEKNPIRYDLYRTGSGRESFVNRTCTIREEKNIKWSD